jgi:hypothetical protein
MYMMGKMIWIMKLLMDEQIGIKLASCTLQRSRPGATAFIENPFA